MGACTSCVFELRFNSQIHSHHHSAFPLHGSYQAIYCYVGSYAARFFQSFNFLSALELRSP